MKKASKEDFKLLRRLVNMNDIKGSLFLLDHLVFKHSDLRNILEEDTDEILRRKICNILKY